VSPSFPARIVGRALLAILASLWPLAGRPQQAPTPAILDLASLPPMRPPGADLYRRHFLIAYTPRVWAVGSNGAYAGVYGGKDLATVRDKALAGCAAKGGTECAIYAQDLEVVWHGRVGTAPAAPPGAVFAEDHAAFLPDTRFLWYGPQAARGVIVWGHGYGGALDDERGFTPPAFLRPLNNAGFDVLRFDRDPAWDSDADTTEGWLRAGLRALRQKGWRMIVAGGQSRGGWNALQLLLEPGDADVIITTSAGRFGRDPGNLILKGETMLWELANRVPKQSTRLAFLQFKDDPFAGDEDKRAGRIRDMVGPKIGALLLIDRPEGFTGHMGGYPFGFAERFGDCILRFVTEPRPAGACE
jgi:hypothetical protein